jgi:hypothetical protein
MATLAGCGLPEATPRTPPASGTAPRAATAGPSASTSKKARPALPDVTPFIIAADEPARPVKRAAVAYLEALLNYPHGGGSLSAGRERLAARGLPAQSVVTATSLLHEDAAGAVQVVYPQLGGLTAASSSIMTVVRLAVLRDDTLTTSTRTIDVRLAKRGGVWQVTRIASAGGRAPQPRDGSSLAGQVVTSPNIVLPDTGRWDIHAGRVDGRILRMLLRLSRDHRLSVCVLSSGHPVNVFGSASVSNHTRGRAVDIWAIDGKRVAAYARQPGDAGNPARVLMETALRYGSDEVGGPWSFATRYGGTFTNTVHEDHLHIGFKR